MTDSHTTRAAATVTEEAASWFLRVQDRSCTAEERRQFEAWLRADPAHAREYDSLMEVWDASGGLRPSTLPGFGSVPAVRQRRRPRLMALAASISIALLGGLLAWHQGYLPHSYRQYSSDADTIRDVTLPDGSQVQLNLHTQLRFLGFRDRREVRLGPGEAYFKVRRDAAHPFTVRAGGGRITVTGTQFNVWHSGDDVIVTLAEGSVKVRGDVSHADRQVVYLASGQQASYSRTDPLPRIRHVNLQNALAWREGKLILDDVSLGEALPLINRYLKQPVRLGDDAVASVRIGGIFNTRDIEGLVRNLPKIAPARVAQDGEGHTVIQSRNGRET